MPVLNVAIDIPADDLDNWRAFVDERCSVEQYAVDGEGDPVPVTDAHRRTALGVWLKSFLETRVEKIRKRKLAKETELDVVVT